MTDGKVTDDSKMGRLAGRVYGGEPGRNPDQETSRHGWKFQDTTSLRLTLSRWLEVCEGVLLPEVCAVCGEVPDPLRESSLPVCRRCRDRLRRLEGVACKVCSTPLVSEREICIRCRSRRYAFERNVSLYAYEEHAREILMLYKFRNRKRVAGFFASELAEVLGRFFPGIPVVPVPGRPATVRKRGWDQIGEISRLLHRDYGVPVLPVLVRRRSGRSQKELSYDERLSNLKGAFSYRSIRSRTSESGSTDSKDTGMPNAAVIIDDVFTTGATSSECAETLKKAGVSKVFSVTLCMDL